MVWTQTKRHLQISSAHPDIATSLVQQADLIESLLGMPLPDSVWNEPALCPRQMPIQALTITTNARSLISSVSWHSIVATVLA